MKLFNFGSLNIDHVYDVTHQVQTGETITATSYDVFIGGKGLNQSIAASKAGAQVVHIGAIGPDGSLLKEALVNAGVDVSQLIETDTPSGHAIIQVNEQGDNAIIVYGGANQQLSKTAIDQVFHLITPEDIVLLQNEISNVDYIIERAYERKIPVVLNYSPITESLSLIDLNKVSYLLVNEIEGRAAAKDSQVIEVLTRAYPQLSVVLTLGDKGAKFAKAGREVITQKAYEAVVVDTTGAGDTFTGFFVASVLSNKSIKEALDLSCKASAIAIGKSGASNSVPTLEEVLDK
ncbi:MAG: ribokinase [Erysipelothrix sp.]|nr:ribokinase [Erysipelothrix sp.]